MATGLRPELRLEYVYGFRCKDCRSNILIASTGEVAPWSLTQTNTRRSHRTCVRQLLGVPQRSARVCCAAQSLAEAFGLCSEGSGSPLSQVVYFAASVAIVADRKTNTQVRTPPHPALSPSPSHPIPSHPIPVQSASASASASDPIPSSCTLTHERRPWLVSSAAQRSARREQSDVALSKLPPIW